MIKKDVRNVYNVFSKILIIFAAITNVIIFLNQITNNIKAFALRGRGPVNSNLKFNKGHPETLTSKILTGFYRTCTSPYTSNRKIFMTHSVCCFGFCT